MAVYIPTIAIVTVFSIMVDYIKERKSQQLVNQPKILSHYSGIMITIILILIAGLRWRVGTDYWSYALNYNEYVQNWWQSIVEFNEPGIRIIAAVSSIIYDDYATMFFISSLITIGLSVWTIYKYSDYFSVSIILYIFIGAWHGSFNGVRQYLACAILFAGHRYIVDRKFWKYLLIVLLASTFHISALTMIVLYFIPKRQPKLKDILVLGVIIILGLNLYDPAIEFINNIMINNGRNPIEMDNPYLNQQVNILRIGVMLAPIILYSIITPKNVLSDNDNFYINMMFINAAVYLIAMNSAYFARFAIYTNIFIPLGFSKILKGVNKKTSTLLIYVALILYGVFWGYEIMITENLRNFQWIFER